MAMSSQVRVPPNEQASSFEMVVIGPSPMGTLPHDLADTEVCLDDAVLQDMCNNVNQLATKVDELRSKLLQVPTLNMSPGGWSRQVSTQSASWARQVSGQSTGWARRTTQQSAMTSETPFTTGSAFFANASWLKGHDEVAATEHRFGHESWQATVVRLIHSDRIQLVLSVLLMLDVAAVFTELFLEAHYPECQLITRDAVSCCAACLPLEGDRERRLGSRLGIHAAHGICADGLEPRGQWSAGCDAHKWPVVHALHTTCRLVTFIVLGIFLAELLVLFAALRQGFLRKRLNVLDLVIVVGTLGLETFHQSSLAYMCDPSHLMILARCWRFLRVGHGLVVETRERDEKEIEEMRTHCQEMAEHIYGLQARLQTARAKKTSKRFVREKTTTE